jgi:hypothetical protein
MTTGNEWWRLMPQGASSDAMRILRPRVRAFSDGFVGLLLPIWLIELGFSAFAIGAIVLCHGGRHAGGAPDGG